MSQNFAVQTALPTSGGASFVNLDNAGNVRVTLKNETHTQIAASQTKSPLSATGALGDTLFNLTIVPATTSPGAVTLYDGSGSTGIILFTGGATSVSDLKPFQVTIQAKATTVTNPGWYVSTGANVSVVAVGNFS